MIALIFLCGILMGACGSLLMKIGASQIGQYEIHSLAQIIGFVFKLFTNVSSLIGIGLYFVSAMTWAYLLTKLAVSFVQPILALTYVITPILAMIFLHEHVPLARWAGILVIILGVFIVARTSA